MAIGRIEQNRIVVRGTVQGVGFRLYARAAATSLGLRGKAENLPDGRSLEVVVQGERSLVKQFVLAMRRGPLGADIESIEVTAEPIDHSLNPFYVVR